VVDKKILENLQEFGLSEWEAKVFSSLVLLGQASAGKIAKMSEVPQSKIYLVLENLIDKQLVEILNSRPREYKAIPPESALSLLIEQKQKVVEDLQRKLKTVLAELRMQPQERIFSGVWISRGKNWFEHFNRMADMLNRSKKYVYGMARDFSHSQNYMQALTGAVHRKVKIRIISLQPITPEIFLRVKWYLDRGIEVKVYPTSLHPRILLIDGKEVLLRIDHEPEKREHFRFSSVWIDDPQLVKVFDTYLKNIWQGAKSLRLHEIESQLNEE
jgi:sugar-specific transcriptional regulator TrmB